MRLPGVLSARGRGGGSRYGRRRTRQVAAEVGVERRLAELVAHRARHRLGAKPKGRVRRESTEESRGPCSTIRAVY
eukprot:SAG11_NODE_24_length_24699_cov_10.132195_18_plen_76_part_00